jgi:hypothetical protein
MTKELSLRIIMLLSALESWSFANKSRLPDHTLEELNNVVDELKLEVLK